MKKKKKSDGEDFSSCRKFKISNSPQEGDLLRQNVILTSILTYKLVHLLINTFKGTFSIQLRRSQYIPLRSP